jgi:hypothetical protein
MKKLITFTLLLFSASNIEAQNTSEDYYTQLKKKLISKDSFSASISAGTGIHFLNSTNKAAYTTFVAPKIGYQLNKKFKLTIGLMHYSISGNTFMPVNQNDAFLNSGNKTLNGNILFIEGQYQLNKRTTFAGAAMYDANNFSNKNGNFKGVAIGLDYKINKHGTISFQTIISQGETPYSNSTNGMNNFGNTSSFMSGQDFGSGLNSTNR